MRRWYCSNWESQAPIRCRVLRKLPGGRLAIVFEPGTWGHDGIGASTYRCSQAFVHRTRLGSLLSVWRQRRQERPHDGELRAWWPR